MLLLHSVIVTVSTCRRNRITWYTRTTCRLRMKWELDPEAQLPGTAIMSEFALNLLGPWGFLTCKRTRALSRQVIVPMSIFWHSSGGSCHGGEWGSSTHAGCCSRTPQGGAETGQWTVSLEGMFWGWVGPRALYHQLVQDLFFLTKTGPFDCRRGSVQLLLHSSRLSYH